jgi:hypothetical protein
VVGNVIIDGANDFKNAFKDLYVFASNIKNRLESEPWDEHRTSGYVNQNLCGGDCDAVLTRSPPENLNLVKLKCWCRDEFKCDVKLPETRRCHNDWKGDPFLPFCWPTVKCGNWGFVALKSSDRFPRYDGKVFDSACRQEQTVILANVNAKQRNVTTWSVCRPV